ncbi:hypothetical protein LguiB_020919 [Lonicera macranthoides]
MGFPFKREPLFFLAVNKSERGKKHELVERTLNGASTPSKDLISFVCAYRRGVVFSTLERQQQKGTTTIEGISFDMGMLMKDDKIARKRKYDESLDKASPLKGIRSFFHSLIGQQISPENIRTDAFEKMEKLRLLKLNYTHVDGRYDNFPKSLIWLCWHGFPSKHMPIELSLENLIALDLHHSKLEEVWGCPKFLGSLKILNLSYSERLVKTPNFLGVPNLERLILKGCVSLIEICESIEFLEELDLLDLTDCKNLRKLPRNMYKLGSLETLIISGCLTLFADGLDKSATSNSNGQGKWWHTSLLMPRVPQPSRGGEIPSCFSERTNGSSMSFTVSSVPKCRIQCLNIRSVYAWSGRGCTYFPFAIKIINKTKDLTWVYCPRYYAIPEYKDMTWLSQWNFGNQLEGGDKIVVSILMGDMLKVKECGIKIVYEEEDNRVVTDDKNNKLYFHWNEVVGGDLSRLQLSKGTYFLCRQLYKGNFTDMHINSYRNALGDMADFEGVFVLTFM